MHVRIILVIFLLMVSFRGMADHPPNFKTVDSLSYDLYEKGEWKALIRFGKNAINQGFDYYYLRMRIGIAYYESEKYLLALEHFRKSLESAPGFRRIFLILGILPCLNWSEKIPKPCTKISWNWRVNILTVVCSMFFVARSIMPPIPSTNRKN